MNEYSLMARLAALREVIERIQRQVDRYGMIHDKMLDALREMMKQIQEELDGK